MNVVYFLQPSLLFRYWLLVGGHYSPVLFSMAAFFDPFRLLDREERYICSLAGFPSVLLRGSSPLCPSLGVWVVTLRLSASLLFLPFSDFLLWFAFIYLHRIIQAPLSLAPWPAPSLAFHSPPFSSFSHSFAAFGTSVLCGSHCFPMPPLRLLGGSWF